MREVHGLDRCSGAGGSLSTQLGKPCGMELCEPELIALQASGAASPSLVEWVRSEQRRLRQVGIQAAQFSVGQNETCLQREQTAAT